jgi:hypothetical protein
MMAVLTEAEQRRLEDQVAEVQAPQEHKETPALEMVVLVFNHPLLAQQYIMLAAAVVEQQILRYPQRPVV